MKQLVVYVPACDEDALKREIKRYHNMSKDERYELGARVSLVNAKQAL